MAALDFLLDDDGDLLIQNNDLVIGPSDDQHNEAIVMAAPGQIRCSPVTGLALIGRMKARFTLKDADTLTQDMRLQFQTDGATDINIQLNSIIDLNVEAYR